MIQPEMDAISHVIDSLYAAGYDDRAWPDALEDVRRLFGASGACIGRAGPQPAQGDVLAAASDPTYQTAYVEHYAKHNLLWDAARALPPGTVYSSETPLPRGALRQSLFWSEWMAPQDYHSTLGCTIAADDGMPWLFDIERGANQPEFDDRDIGTLKIVGRTVQKAMALRRKLGADRIERSHAATALNALSVGAIVIDVQGRPVYINDAASSLLSDQGHIFLYTHGKLRLRSRDLSKRWNMLISTACAPDLAGGGFLWIGSQGSDVSDISVHIGPFVGDRSHGDGTAERRALVLMRPLAPTESVERQLVASFGLTTMEGKVAAALAAGMPAARIADIHHVRISTIRTHISSIFAKTGTNQQAEFFALVANMQLPLAMACQLQGVILDGAQKSPNR